jgi:hypothetical protein
MISDYLCDYVDLPGVEGGRRRGPMCRTITDFRTAMAGYAACSSAGDHGAVTVWKDDVGQWRVAFQRYRNTEETQTFRFKLYVFEWLREWLPKMHTPA